MVQFQAVWRSNSTAAFNEMHHAGLSRLLRLAARTAGQLADFEREFVDYFFTGGDDTNSNENIEHPSLV